MSSKSFPVCVLDHEGSPQQEATHEGAVWSFRTAVANKWINTTCGPPRWLLLFSGCWPSPTAMCYVFSGLRWIYLMQLCWI
eukprot:SAG22_NODE_1395_length_4511_cov_3.492747_4_plen_81_part_00